jgi:hypothetical protein
VKRLVLLALMVSAFAPALSASASGVIMLSGKLRSFTQTHYLVETKRSIYFIRKSGLNPKVAAKLNRNDMPVNIAVPFDAISVIKSKPKQPVGE